jgi:hypothetical protein
MMKKMIINLFSLFSIVVPTWNLHRILRSSFSSSKKKRFLQSQSSFSTSIAKLTASNGGIDDCFGDENQVSISNNRIVVGALGYDTNRGAVYLFGDSRNPQSGHSYSQLAFLTANDGEIDDWFGDSVAVHGDIIVVGASEFLSDGPGAAYVYRIITDENNNFVSISQVAKLTASNGVANDYFGFSVAVRGKYILVGAIGVDKNGSLDFGSAYLFGNLSNNSNTPEWTELQQIQPNDLTEADLFGYSVAMDDNIAIIGTCRGNAAYVFAPVNSSSSSLSLSTSWTLTAKLTGSMSSDFGYSVAVTRNWIVVGAFGDDNSNGNGAGAVFVFTKTSSSSSSTWTQMTQLLAADGAAEDWFGISVSISKDASTIVVGADWVDFNSNITNSGAAYMFRNINSMTTQMGKFVAADRNANNSLGSSIAMENNIVVVGACGDDSYTGSVYVVDTGFSSSTPPPTAQPRTAPPTAMLTDVDQQPNSDSKNVFTPGVIVGMSAIVGVVVLGLGIAYFNYRIKREAREQQQQGMNTADDQIPPPPSPPSSSSNIPAAENTAAAADDETTTPIMADAVVLVVPPPAQEVRDETLQAAAFLDPATAAVAVVAKTAAAAAAAITTPTKKGLPRYKDQVRAVQPPGPSATNLPSLPKRNHQIHDQDDFPRQNKYPKEEEKEEEKEQSLEDQPPAVLPQQQQNKPPILHPDPPAAINYDGV